MRTSASGRAAITRHEGLRLTAYPDPATGGEPWTIGVGHTSRAGPPKVTKGMKITRAQADEILSRDLAAFEAAVSKAVKVPLNQNEFDALVSLAFNIGAGAFAKSTLVKKLNAGDRAGAANAFLSWNKAAGKVMKGLTKRREDERRLFLSKADAPKAPAEPIPAAPPAAPTRTDSTLRRGSYGPIVGDLQRNLNVLGYGPLKVDDRFGEDTERAVIAFQNDHGLLVDGIAGGRTNTAIGKTIKDRETKPKLDAAASVVDDAAGKGVSKTEVITTVTGIGGVATVVKETADSVRDGATSLMSLGPWILLAFVIAAGAGYVIWERRRKRLAAKAVQEVL